MARNTNRHLRQRRKKQQIEKATRLERKQTKKKQAVARKA